jgi:hypothetical protein
MVERNMCNDGRMRIIVYLMVRSDPRWEPYEESLMYGSVRGARGNSRPYRDMDFAAVHESAYGTKRRNATSHQFGRYWRHSGHSANS